MCWLPDASGELKKHWRLGPNKAYPAFRLEGIIKYLGIIVSYANFEMLTLRHRLAEAGKKIQQVRSPAARLRVWFATVWATAIADIPEVGLTPEAAHDICEAGALTRSALFSTSQLMSPTSLRLTFSHTTNCRTPWALSFGA